MYGWRARVGVIVPSVNTCTEPQFRMLAPVGVEVYVTRLRLRGGSGTDELLAMAAQAEAAASLLADLDPSYILFHCTAASVAGGPGSDRRISDRIMHTTGCPAGTTATGVVSALQALGARRLALVSPYVPATNALETAFLEGNGFEVVEDIALGLEGGAAFVRIEPEQWRQVVRQARTAAADAIFVSCTNIRVLETIDLIEADTDKPVVTSNQAAVWYVLRQLGIKEPVAGYGQLLRDVVELPGAGLRVPVP